MKKLTCIMSTNKSVVSVVDTSDDYMDRARITFTNGNILSIIRGSYTCGGDDGLYEIAIIDKNDSFITSEALPIAEGDDVIGYLTEDDVHCIIEEVAAL